MALQLLDGLGRVLASTGEEADLYEIGDDEGSGDDKKKVYAKPKNGDPVTAYVETAQLPSHETVSIPQNFAGLDSVAVPTRLRYQLFTITKVSEQDDYVEIVATHIFYEQINNFTMWEPETLVNYSCGAICRNVLRNQIGNDGGFRVVTDCTDELPWHQIDYARKNIVEAFLNPEDGICTRFNLSMIRDNMDFYVLKNVGYDRGMVIEDGLNLLGIEREENIENVITRVAAYGRDADGDLVWLNNNGNRYVDSTHINDYARPRVELYDTGIYITGAKEAEELHEQGRDNEIVTADNINAKILAKAQERFTKDEVDVPEVTMNIDFVSLGDTEEYKQYRDLDKVFLYDIVHVKDKRRDYNYSAQVIGVEHDVLTGALLSATIGNLTTWDGVRKVANWQVPEIDGSIIRLHSITSSQYAYESITTEAIKDNSVTGDKVNVQSVSQALDLNSLKSILAQAGLVLNDQGILIYQNTDDNMLGTRLEVQGRRIGMVIGTYQGQDYIKAGEIALAFNNADESVAHINADHVNISATSTLHTLAGAVEEDDNGNVTIVSAGGMRVRKTSGGITSEFGVFDTDNLTAGVIVDKVNGGSVTIKGSKVWVGDASTDQTLKKWATESDGLFAQNIGALSARIGTIEADYITASEVDANFITTRLAQASSVSVALLNTSGAAIFGGGTYATNGLWVEGTRLTIGNGNFVQSVVGASTTGGGYKFTVTQADGSSVDYPFNVASSITFSGAWTGASYTATAKDPDDNVLGTVTTAISRDWSGTTLRIVSGTDILLSEAITGGTGLGASTQGTPYTINTFNSSHKAYGYVDAPSHPAGRLFSFNVDATSEFNTGRNSGWTSAYNQVAFPSAGTGTSFQISAPGATLDGSPDTRTFTMTKGTPGTSGYAAVSNGNNAVARIDISDWYTTGRSDGAASVTLSESGWVSGVKTITASNGATVSVSIPAIDMSEGGWSNHIKRVSAFSNAGNTGELNHIDVDATSEYTSGRNSVVPNQASWGTRTYSNKVYTTPVTITCNNGASKTFTGTFIATEAYNAGAASRDISSLSDIMMLNTETWGTYPKSTVATFADGSTQTVSVGVNTSNVYGKGWDDGNASGYSTGYSAGHTDGYSAGYADGYPVGVNATTLRSATVSSMVRTGASYTVYANITLSNGRTYNGYSLGTYTP